MSTTRTAPAADTAPGSDAPALRVVDLAVEGMTCASCVARVEKKLSRLEGVSASVNLATESARVTAPASIGDDELVSTVVRAGYAASVVGSTALGDRADATTPGGTVPSTTPGGAPQSPPSDDGPGTPSADDHPAGAPGTADERGPLPADRTGSEEGAAAPRLGASHLTRAAELRMRLVYSLVLSVPVMAISMLPALQLPGWQWAVAVMAVPVATWGAWPFHRAAWSALRHGSFTMDSLVSLGVVAATGWSLWALIRGGAGEIGMTMSMELLPRHQGHAAHLYFESAAWVTTFLLAGRYAEAWAKYRSGDALRALLELGAKEATRITLVSPSGSSAAIDVLDDEGAPRPDAVHHEETVPVDLLRVGDLFAVRPGEKLATDGVVVEGASAVDASMLTGESVPVEVGPGEAVTGGCVNASGALLVRATRVGEGTTLARIGAMVTAAQAGKAPVQRLADRVSGVFVPAVIALSLATLAGWLALGHPLQHALMAAVSVLVIACPCALGLATPTALLVGSGRAAQLGVVIKGPEVLESTRALDTIVLDKTGTVTQGRMSLDADRGVVVLDAAESGGAAPHEAGSDNAAGSSTGPAAEPTAGQRRALALAGAVEAASEHPVAAAVVAAARRVLGPLPPVRDFAAHEGRGVSGTVALEGRDHAVAVGRPAWLAERGVALGDRAREAVDAAERTGATVVVLAVDGRAEAVLAVRDTIRPSSPAAVAALRRLGVRPVLLTGDNARTAAHVAEQVGIPAGDVRAQVLPADKRDVVAALQAEGRVVGMVGDGVNDAAALAQAGRQGLGLAMGSGTDVAIEAADITLVRADLEAAVTAIRISRRTLRIIKQNLFWAFFYNVLAIPLAVLGLLNPMIAGAAMAASSVLVVANSLRLRRAGG